MCVCADGGTQFLQDAQEFMRLVLDRLHLEATQPEVMNPIPAAPATTDGSGGANPLESLLNEDRSRRRRVATPPVEPGAPALGSSSIVTDVFRGRLLSQVTCMQCKQVSSVTDPFLDLSLDIPARFHVKPSKASTQQPPATEGEGPCTLRDCLSFFTETEDLRDDDRCA